MCVVARMVAVDLSASAHRLSDLLTVYRQRLFPELVHLLISATQFATVQEVMDTSMIFLQLLNLRDVSSNALSRPLMTSLSQLSGWLRTQHTASLCLTENILYNFMSVMYHIRRYGAANDCQQDDLISSLFLTACGLFQSQQSEVSTECLSMMACSWGALHAAKQISPSIAEIGTESAKLAILASAQCELLDAERMKTLEILLCVTLDLDLTLSWKFSNIR